MTTLLIKENEMSKKQEISKIEKEDNLRFLDTVNMAWIDNLEGGTEAEILVGMIMEQFEFCHSGFNGHFKDWDELSNSISEWIESTHGKNKISG